MARSRSRASTHHHCPAPRPATCHADQLTQADKAVADAESVLAARCRISRATRSPAAVLDHRAGASRSAGRRHRRDQGTGRSAPACRPWPGDDRPRRRDQKRQCPERGRPIAGSRSAVAGHRRSQRDQRGAIGDIVVKAAPAAWSGARCGDGSAGRGPGWQRIVEDGKPAVSFNIYEQPDGNAVQIAGRSGSGWPG